MWELALGDKGGNAGGQGIDTLTGELMDVGEEFILEVPEMLLRLDNCPDGI